MAKFENGLLLYNGNMNHNKLEKMLKQTLPSLSLAIKSLQIVQTKNIDELRERCVYYSEKVEILIVLGGDGTVHAVINALASLKKRPLIGILPGGTSNDFSRTLGIPQNLQAATEVIGAGKTTQIDLVSANENYYLNFWGIGLIADTSENIDENEKEKFGVLSYFMSTVRTMKQADHFTYRLKNDQIEQNGEAILIGVFNGRYIGTREIAIPQIQPNDGKLDVIIVKNSSATSFRELLKIANPYSDVKEFEEVDHFQVTKLIIETDVPKLIDMDGEMYEQTPAVIEILPNHLEMIYGEDFLLQETDDS